MKVIKVNDNILINIEQVYSLEKYNNKQDILKWEEMYNNNIAEYMENPPEIEINGALFIPDYSKELNLDDPNINEYLFELHKLIYNNIGEKPIFKETYKLIMSTGLRITISKDIYDIIYKEMEKYVLK